MRTAFPQRCPSIPQPNQVACPQRRIRCKGLLLRYVSNTFTAAFHCVAAQRHSSGMQFLQPQKNFQEACFSAAIGPKNGKELSGVDVQVQIPPQCPLAELQARSAEAHYRCQKLSSIHAPPGGAQ